MAKTGTGVILDGIGRLFKKEAAPGIRVATDAADDVAEAGAKFVLKAIPLEISDKALKEAGMAAAEKALKSSGRMGARKASEAMVSNRAENAMTALVKETAQNNYKPFMDSANKTLELAIESGDQAAIKRAEHAVAKVQTKISDDVASYLGDHGNEISGMAAEIGHRVKNGSAAYRYTVGYAGKHPYLTTAAGVSTAGAVGVYGVLGSLADTVKKITPEGLKETFSAAMSGLGNVGNLGFKGLGSVFNTASEGLEYMGVDPTLAKGIVGLGTFFALRGALNLIAEQTGFNKIMPGVGLGVLIAAGILAYKIADSAGAFENTADISNRSVNTAGLSAPAMAPAPVM